jgi:crossover junction endodeoxyribonuclease RuvC
MIFLGIDIGIAITGIGVIDKTGAKISYIAHTAILTEKNTPTAQRLSILKQELEKLIVQYKPAIAAVEELFYFKNAKTIINVAQARGVVLLTLEENKIPIEEYTPLEVKQAISSYGRADKLQVQKMVKMLLGLNELPQPDDAADALAIAWCCANTLKLL